MLNFVLGPIYLEAHVAFHEQCVHTSHAPSLVKLLIFLQPILWPQEELHMIILQKMENSSLVSDAVVLCVLALQPLSNLLLRIVEGRNPLTTDLKAGNFIHLADTDVSTDFQGEANSVES